MGPEEPDAAVPHVRICGGPARRLAGLPDPSLERGTEAAAAPVVVGTESASMDVAARPFLLAIRDDLTGAILFLGRVTDPT